MFQRRLPTLRARHTTIALAALAALTYCSTARALGPDSPEVKATIERGIQYLEGASYGAIGGKALLGLTMVKYGKDDGHPKVTEAVNAISNAMKDPKTYSDSIYGTGISIMFLVALDPEEHRSLIADLVQSLHYRQKTDGAWGYPVGGDRNPEDCDTSMTQYAVLGLWEAQEQAGAGSPVEVWDRIAQWLIRTQDPGGGFGYQGKPSTKVGDKVKQSGVKDSMVVAALGSMYIVRNQLGLSELKKAEDDDTPPELQPYESEEARRERIKTELHPRLFAQALIYGNRWMAQNYAIENPKGWLYYYLYALERYESLKAADRGVEDVKENNPSWYDRGARFLIRKQQPNGAWGSKEDGSMDVPDTCFAILFLLRSTQKSLEKTGLIKYQAGISAGGRGLPKVADVRVRDGNVVVKPLTGSVRDLLQIVQQPDHADYDAALEGLRDLIQTGDHASLDPYLSEFRKLATTGARPVRLVSVQVLGMGRDLDNVPTLIAALNDGDLSIALAARDALRAVSRSGETDSALKLTEAQRAEEVSKWKDWYLAIRPDTVLD